MLSLLAFLACSPDYSLNPGNDANKAGDETGIGEEDYTSDPIDTAKPGDTEESNVEGEPIADAGDDQLAAPLATVTLDGSDSWDPNNRDPLSYQWSLVSVPSGSTASLSSSTQEKPKLWLDIAGTYELALTVKNSEGVWDSTPDRMTVEAVPNDGFYVQLAWDTESDQDLHLLRSGAKIYDVPGDCSWCNLTPSWGTGGSQDDPSLDWDTIDAYGPETTTIDEPANDTYSVLVHYYGQDGFDYCWGACPSTKATVKIFFDGIEKASYTKTMKDQGDVWHVADIKWPQQSIQAVDTMGYTPLISCW